MVMIEISFSWFSVKLGCDLEFKVNENKIKFWYYDFCEN